MQTVLKTRVCWVWGVFLDKSNLSSLSAGNKTKQNKNSCPAPRILGLAPFTCFMKAALKKKKSKASKVIRDGVRFLGSWRGMFLILDDHHCSQLLFLCANQEKQNSEWTSTIQFLIHIYRDLSHGICCLLKANVLLAQLR